MLTSSPLRSRKRQRLSVTFASPPHELPEVRNWENDNRMDSDSDSDGSLFHWDDESTLLDELLDKPRNTNGDTTVQALTNSLRDAFVERGKVTKTEMAQVLVSANCAVKRAVSRLSDQDDSYCKYVVQFGRGCKRTEAAYMHIGRLLEKFIVNQEEIEHLRAQIKTDLAEREAIWAGLERSMKQTLHPLRKRISDAPALVERKITQLEEQAKALEKKHHNSIPKDLQNYLKNL